MNVLIGLVLTGLLAAPAHGSDKRMLCQIAPPNVPSDWITMNRVCVKKMMEQIQTELEAALTYMAMGAHFYRDTVNRPGFGELFFEFATEEREHAAKITEYLLKRGELTQDVKELIRNPAPSKTEWPNAASALKDALKLEASVTEKIRSIMRVCEDPPKTKEERPFNDHHLVDYLSGDFLDEEYRDQRQLAAYISDLGKMMDVHGTLGEFLFDKKLLDKRIAV